MKNTKMDYNLGEIIVIIITFFILGVFAGSDFTEKEIIKTIPERKEECEALGGKYNYQYSDYYDYYVEICRTRAMPQTGGRIIKDF